MNAIGEFLGLSEVGKLALHPDEISERSICKSTVDGTLAAALVAVVTLSCSGSRPVEVDVLSGELLSDSTSFSVALALRSLQEVVNGGLLVGDGALVNLLNGSLAEELKASLRHPLVFNSLELCTLFALGFCSVHEISERLKVGVCGTNDESMVAGIDGGGDEGSSLRVGSRDSKEIGA